MDISLLFIYWSAAEHLGCFYFGAAIIKAAMKIDRFDAGSNLINTMQFIDDRSKIRIQVGVTQSLQL